MASPYGPLVFEISGKRGKYRLSIRNIDTGGKTVTRLPKDFNKKRWHEEFIEVLSKPFGELMEALPPELQRFVHQDTQKWLDSEMVRRAKK